MTADKPRGLGRGLDALLAPAAPRPGTPAKESGLFVCPLERIVPQKGQPRQQFDEEALRELAESIADHGLLEPLVVRRVPGDKFEIIAGERRWRAAQRAGLREVPVAVKDVSPSRAFELALIENVQRADLNPLELAEALERLLTEHGYTHEALGTALKKDRTTITNSLRLLKLPARVRKLVSSSKLSEGHARALLAAVDAKRIEALADEVVAKGLSVRKTEALVRKASKPRGSGASAPSAKETRSAAVRDLEARLSRRFATRVELADASGKGTVTFHYGSLDELDRLLAMFER